MSLSNVSVAALVEMAIEQRTCYLKYAGNHAYGFTKADLRSVIEQVLQICSNNSEPAPQLQQAPCSTLLPKVQEMIDVIEAEKVRYPRMWTADVLRLLNRVKELAAIA